MNLLNAKWKYGEREVERLVVDDYNKMGDIYKNDAMISNYSCLRKSFKRKNKVVFHFAEEAVFNTFIIMKVGTSKRFLDHKLELIKVIIKKTNTSENRC